MHSVCILTINWNGFDLTAEMLRSLQQCASGHALYVAIIDNASSDDSTVRLREEFSLSLGEKTVRGEDVYSAKSLGRIAELRLIQGKANLGFAGGYNNLISYALSVWQCEFFWILNNDVMVTSTSITSLLEAAEAEPSIDLFGSVVRYASKPEQVQAFGGCYFNTFRAIGSRQVVSPQPDALVAIFDVRRDNELFYLMGASIFLRRSFLEEHSEIEDSYFLYFEELDWLLNSGVERVGVASKSVIHHRDGGSIGTGIRSKRSRYYLSRALILFYRRNFPQLLLSALYRATRELLICIAKGDFGGSRAIGLGVLDGLLRRHGECRRSM